MNGPKSGLEIPEGLSGNGFEPVVTQVEPDQVGEVGKGCFAHRQDVATCQQDLLQVEQIFGLKLMVFERAQFLVPHFQYL